MNSTAIYKKSSAFVAVLVVLISLWSTTNMQAQKLRLDWVRQVGNFPELWSFSDKTNGIAVDHKGNVLSTGFYTTKVDFDPGPNTFWLRAPNVARFVYKLDANGNFIWAKDIQISTGECNDIAVDEDDNVYITGNFQNTVDFNPGTGVYNLTHIGGSVTPYGAFLLKLNAQGDFLWARKVCDGIGNAVAIDTAGNAYVTGENPVANYSTGIFISKYDPSGNLVLFKDFTGNAPSTGGGRGYDIAVDAVNNIFITGTCKGIVDFDPGPGVYNVNTFGDYYIFTLKVDATGNFNWVKAMGSLTPPQLIREAAGYSIAVDPFNDVVVAGRFFDGVDFNPGGATPMVLTAPYLATSAFLQKIRNNGEVVFAKNLDTCMPGSRSICTDDEANIYTGGSMLRVLTAVGGGYGGIKNDGIYLDKFDSSGNHSWILQWNYRKESHRSNGINAMDRDKSGNIYLGGFFNGTADFDPGPDSVILTTDQPTSSGLTDGTIIKLTCSDTSSATVKVTWCQESYQFYDKVYTKSGNYIHSIPKASGCDSIIHLQLSMFQIAPAVITVNGFILGTATPYATYQWLDNGAPIQGGTASTCQVTHNGVYGVIVSTGPCSDTAYYTVTNVGIDDARTYTQSIQVYPNPAKDVVYIKSPVSLNAVITSIDGKQLLITGETTISLKHLSSGMYFIRLFDNKGNLIKVEKLVRE